MGTNKITANEMFYYITIGIAFFIPVWPNILPLLIICLIVNRLIIRNIISSFKKMNNKGMFYLSISPYLLYAVGLLYSENISFGLRDMETKLSLLLFPLLFFTSPSFEQKKMNNILWSFVIGCLAAFVICLAWGVYNFIDEQIDMSNGVHRDNFRYYYFFSSRFSPFLHPSYLAMYVVFGLIVVHQLMLKKFIQNKKIFLFICIVFTLFILLLNSKAGILSLTLFGVYFIGRKIIIEKHMLQALLIMVSFTGVITLLYFSVDEFAKKINNTIKAATEHKVDTTADDSSSKRILVWSASRKIISDNYLIGVGTGDVKDALLNEYKEKKMNIEYDANLNSHNQYYQTFIAIGIIGFLALLFFFLLPAYFTIKNKDFIYFGFILLFCINIFVESMLETQAGVIFYAFFNTLLGRNKQEN